MKNTRSIGWIAATVVLMLAISALTYFLLYLPRADDAAAKLEEAEVVRAENDILAMQIAQLAADFEHLDEYRADLAALATQIPPDRDWDTVLEMLNGMAAAAGLPLPLLDASVSDATPVTVFAAPAAQPAPTDETTDGTAVDQAGETAEDAEAAADAQDGAEDAAAPEAATPTGPVAVDGLTMVPFSVKVSGPYANVTTFLNALQNHEGRVFFIGDFDMLRLTTTDATPLRPAVADGDLELTVRGTFFSLIPSSVPATAQEETPPPGLPTSGANPFVPLEPTR